MKQYNGLPSLGNKNLTQRHGHPRLVANDRRMDDASSLFSAYTELKDVWHRTKIEANRQRAMSAYNVWIVSSFPKDQQISLLLRSTSTWGFN
jgi:hypothetical protein